MFINPDDDHFVTRLTHTLNVTQIGRSIARALSLNEDLTEAVCLAHDVGHPPFGHVGETALSAFVAGRWLHSEQSLRIYRVLEPANLTWEVRDGIRAHSWKVDPPPASAEGLVCRFADRIAYLSHDVVDALRAGVIHRNDLPLEAVGVFGEPGSSWVGAMVEAVIDGSVAAGEVAMTPAVLQVMHDIRDFMFERVYDRPEAQDQHRRAEQVIRRLVEHFAARPQDMPESFREGDYPPIVRVIDYVAGMTDRYALSIEATIDSAAF